MASQVEKTVDPCSCSPTPSSWSRGPLSNTSLPHCHSTSHLGHLPVLWRLHGCPGGCGVCVAETTHPAHSPGAHGNAPAAGGAGGHLSAGIHHRLVPPTQTGPTETTGSPGRGMSQLLQDRHKALPVPRSKHHPWTAWLGTAEEKPCSLSLTVNVEGKWLGLRVQPQAGLCPCSPH